MAGSETGRRRSGRFLADLRAALAYPASDPRRLAAAGALGVVTFVGLVFSTFPGYTAQMLSAGVVRYAGTAFVALLETTYRSVGGVGVGLIVAYALLTGVAFVNVGTQVARTDVSGLSDILGVVPGLLASGCASCGAGVLGLLGFAGALAAMPFHGNLLRLAGLVLLLLFLGRAGDPRRCRLT
jgi:hypothetical protein